MVKSNIVLYSICLKQKKIKANLEKKTRIKWNLNEKSFNFFSVSLNWIAAWKFSRHHVNHVRAVFTAGVFPCPTPFFWCCSYFFPIRYTLLHDCCCIRIYEWMKLLFLRDIGRFDVLPIGRFDIVRQLIYVKWLVCVWPNTSVVCLMCS